MVSSFQSDTPWIGNERQAQLITLVDELGMIRVAEMSKRFGVTEETIRRDLERLEKEGYLSRVHGGAVSLKKSGSEIPVLKREQTNIEEKRAIALKAASFIEDGDIIGIDSSTTALQMAKFIKDKEITVITNSIAVTLELANQKGITVITVGGYLLEDSLSFVGVSTQKVIEDYHLDKFFFSCTGFDAKRGISEVHEMQAQIKKQFISISDQLFLLADYSKYGTKSLVSIENLKNVDYLITDDKMAVNDVMNIRNLGINTIVAD